LPIFSSYSSKSKMSSSKGLNVTILGAAGFLGARLAAQLLADGILIPPPDASEKALADPFLSETPIAKLCLFDMNEPKVPANSLDIKVECFSGDVSNVEDVAKAIPRGTNVVFQLAAVVSGQAEADYELGVRVNTRGNEAVCAVLKKNREAGDAPARIVFTSSVASFSVSEEELNGPKHGVLDDSSAQRPLNSYGAQKAMAEVLLSDLSRRGIHAAASSFLSGIIREPLLGEAANCPVPEAELATTKVWLASPASAVEWLRYSSAADTNSVEAKKRWGASRSVTPPGVSCSVAALLGALAKRDTEALKLVTFEPDEKVMGIVKSWPPGFLTERGQSLGFRAGTGGVDGIVAEFLEVGLAETRMIRGLI
jgi:dTDP-4-dehydrorhamnose reductase